MAAGGAGNDRGGAGTRSEAIKILPQYLSSDGLVSDVGEVVEHRNSDNMSLDDAFDSLPPPNQLLDDGSSVTGTNQGVREREGRGGEDASACGVAPERGLLHFIPLKKVKGRAEDLT